jgi:hypothetical protein
MPGGWRQDIETGRERVRAALEGRVPRQQQQLRARPAGREEPFLNAVLYDSAPRPEQAAAGETAALAAEIESLRALIGELSQAGEAALASNEELQRRADCLTEVLKAPGVRKMLLSFHPDRHPGADDNQRQALTETAAKINAAFDLIDRPTNTAA